MSDGTGIEWTDATWNPVVGCTHISAGCDHCYAAREASSRLSKNPVYAGLAAGGKFTGEVRLLRDRLQQPLHWTKPRMVFVNSMSDLFHQAVPDSFIVDVFDAMAMAPRHTFQVLTKRHARMRSFVTKYVAGGFGSVPNAPDVGLLPNVWLGVSVENQQWADIRIPALLETPAAVRFLSCEPLLGQIYLGRAGAMYLDRPGYAPGEDVNLAEDPDFAQLEPRSLIDWVIAGGESGPGARPMHPEWARSLRDQCQAAGVPFLFKQWGEWREASYADGTHLIQVTGQYVTRESATSRDPYGPGTGLQDLVDRGHPGWVRIRREGKRVAGRELDGRTWDEYPERVAC